MTPRCPTCRRDLPLADVNVERDTALCRQCGGTFSFADLVAGDGAAEAAFDPLDPPRGAWFTPAFDGFEAGVSTRSPFAIFLVPFLCVWSGFSLGGIYGTQVWTGRFNLLMSLFGIPFVLGTFLFGSIALMSVAGKYVVSVAGDEGRIFVGVGPLGWTRHFAWSGITRIVEGQWVGNHGRPYPTIVLEGTRRLVIQGLPSQERQYFLLQALRAQLRAAEAQRPGRPSRPAGGP